MIAPISYLSTDERVIKTMKCEANKLMRRPHVSCLMSLGMLRRHFGATTDRGIEAACATGNGMDNIAQRQPLSKLGTSYPWSMCPLVS